MHPTLHLGPLDFPAYFTLLTFGYLLAIILAWRECFKMKGIDPNKLLDLSIVLLIAGLLGARILHVIADGHFDDYVNLCLDPLKVKGRFLPGGSPCITDSECLSAERGAICNIVEGTCHQGRDCLRVIKVWYGGLAFYGGLFLAIAAGIWYTRRYPDRLDTWKIGDLAGIGIPLGLVFGRIGCWFSGCCFGGVTEHDHGAVFPKFSPAWDRHLELDLITRKATEALPVIPTQAIHIISNLAIFLLCYLIFKKWRKYDGWVFWIFMALYAVSRFIIEFWRDDHRGVWLGETLSTSQILAIPAILASVVMLWYLRRRHLSLYGGPGEPPVESEPDPETDAAGAES